MKKNPFQLIGIILLGGILGLPILSNAKSAKPVLAADQEDKVLDMSGSKCKDVLGNAYSSNDFNYSDISFGRKNVFCENTSGNYSIQTKGNTQNGFWTKSTYADTYISKIEITVKNAAVNLYLSSSSTFSSSSTSVAVGSTTLTFIKANDYHYFKLLSNGTYNKISVLKVTYSPSTGTDPDPIFEGDYDLVKDASTLKTGDEIVLGVSSKAVAAGKFSSKSLTGVLATIKDESLSSEDANVLTLSKTDNGFKLLSNEGYIGTTVAKELSLNEETEWTISIDSSTYKATIEAGELGHIMYNCNGTSIFRNYTSSESDSMILPEIYLNTKAVTSTYTVTYDGNGAASGEMVDSNSPYNKASSVSVKENAFVPVTGNVFKEFNTKADGTGTAYQPGSTFTITADTTLYAIWEDEYIPTGDTYTLVSNVSTLKAGDKLLLVGQKDGDYYAQSALDTDHDCISIAKTVLNNGEMSFSGNDVKPLILGGSAGAWTFEYETGSKVGAFGAPNNKISTNPKQSGISFTWTMTQNSDKVTILNTKTDYGYLQFSGSNNRISNYKSTSNMTDCQIYAKSGHAKEVHLSAETVDLNAEQTAEVRVLECIGFEPTSYAWEITEGSEFLSITAGQGTSEVTLTGLKEGEAKLIVTVDGVKAVATISVHEYKYNVLEGDAYFITSTGGMMSSALTNMAEVDFTNTENEWQFEKNYLADNSYYIKNGSGYLNFEEDVNPDRDNISRMCVSSTHVNSWIVEKDDSNYKIHTETVAHGTRYIAQKADDLKWYAFNDVSSVSLFTAGNLVYSTFEVVKGSGITYPYAGDKFEDNNVKINAVFTNGYKKDITKEITWGVINADGTVNGTYTFGGDDKVITLTGINVYVPVENSLTVTGLKEKYSIGESVNVESVKLTYQRASGTTTVRTLKEAEYTVSPTLIDNEETDKITVSFNNIPSITKDYSIEVKPVDFVPASKLGPGDEIILTAHYGNHEYEGMLETDGTNYNRLLGTQYEYAPKGESVFTLESAGSVNSFYLKDKVSGKYLNGQVDGVITSDKVETMESLDGKFKSGEFQFKPSDSDQIITVTNQNTGNALFTYNESFETWNGIVYNDSTYCDYYDLEMIVIDDTALLSVTHVDFNAGTETPCEDIEYRVFNYSPLMLVNPYTTGSTKDAFTFTYNENLDQEIHWWTISCLNKYVGCAQSGDGVKFTLTGTESFDIDVYRNKNIEPSVKVKSLKATADESLLTVTKGGTFNWNNVTVTATYEDKTHAMVDYPAYSVSGLDTNKLGRQTVTITYQGVSTTISIYVLSEHTFQPFIDGDLKEIYVGDTQYRLKTTETAPEGEPVSWKSSNDSIAAIDKDGNIVAKSAGTVIFTVTSFDGYYSDSKEITVSQRVEGISFAETGRTIGVEDEFDLYPIITPDNAKNKRVEFSTEDNDIVSVHNINSSTGLSSYAHIVGLKEGIATIKAVTQNGGFEAYYTVTVEGGGTVVDVESISFAQSSMTVDVTAEDFQLKPIFNPTNATVQTCTFISSNENVASVSANTGWVNPKAVGTTVITATSDQGGKTASITITVKKNVEPVNPTSILLNKTSLSLDLDETTSYKLIASVFPENATYSLTWTSSDTDVAIVEDNGTVLARGKGECTITVSTQNGKTATCKVTVTGEEGEIDVTGVTLNKTSATLEINGTLTLKATVKPTNATNKNVSWSSSNEDIVTVDENGKVTAVAAGTATITVTTEDGSKTATCEITVNGGSEENPSNFDEQKKTAIIILAGSGTAVVGLGTGLGIGIPLRLRRKHKKLH